MSEELKKISDRGERIPTGSGAALGMTKEGKCHSERSEESKKTLHFVQSDTGVPCHCEERSDVAIRKPERSEETRTDSHGLPGKPRNDRDGAKDKVKSHFAALCEQAEELRREFPDFKLSEALKDADFIRLTAPGVGVDLRRAFYACNRERLENLAERRGAEAAREAFAKSLRENAARPVEGGSGAAELRSDYRHMSGESRAELKKQIRSAAARGKKIYP